MVLAEADHFAAVKHPAHHADAGLTCENSGMEARAFLLLALSKESANMSSVDSLHNISCPTKKQEVFPLSPLL